MRNFNNSGIPEIVGLVSGSGAEDIGRTITRDTGERRDAQEYGLSTSDTLTSRERAARAEEAQQRAIEDAARNRRLDRERILVAALDGLESDAIDVRGDGTRVDYHYIAGAANIPTGHGEPNRAAYVRDLLAEIRAEFSPLVR